jgi:hypothetical protein
MRLGQTLVFREKRLPKSTAWAVLEATLKAFSQALSERRFKPLKSSREHRFSTAAEAARSCPAPDRKSA